MMTKDKAQKRAVRARMDKTGERYTIALHYLLELHHPEHEGDDLTTAKPTGGGQPSALPPRVAEPGISDAAVSKATGKTWDEWFAALDAWDGSNRGHPEIARHLHETYGIDGWWAQSVAVGYERARGMRALHERPDGFSMSASKTFPVSAERLFAAFVEPEERERWLEAVELRNRTSQPHKSARFDVLPGETRLALFLTAKGLQKSTVQLNQERLADADEVARWKALWKEQLAVLAEYLGRG